MMCENALNLHDNVQSGPAKFDTPEKGKNMLLPLIPNKENFQPFIFENT